MANTFAGFPLVDPRAISRHRLRFRRPTVRLLERANGLYIPSGKWPTRGWILLDRSSLDDITNKYLTTFELELDAFENGNLTFTNLAIVHAQCVTTGLPDDPDAIYLVEITDRRGVLFSPWFEFPINSYYNVLAPAYPGNFYTPSLNAGVTWTWNAMVENIWNQMTAFLGTYPGLPFAPANQPYNWIFPGVGAWQALCRVLDHLGCSVACNLTATNQYTIVREDDTDSAFTALVALYDDKKEDDAEWIDVGSGRVPGQVNVLFHRVNQFYGTEETIRRDTLQWETDSTYTVPVAAPAEFTNAAGTAYLWDDLSVRYDTDGNPLAADVAIANTVADERVNQFYRKLEAGTTGYMRRLYSGLRPFVTGSQVNGVAYKQDFRYAKRMGWVTEVVRGQQFEEVQW